MSDQSSSRRNVGYGMMAIGITFLVLGITGQKAFLGIGPAFLVIGIVMLAQSKKAT